MLPNQPTYMFIFSHHAKCNCLFYYTNINIINNSNNNNINKKKLGTEFTFFSINYAYKKYII